MIFVPRRKPSAEERDTAAAIREAVAKVGWQPVRTLLTDIALVRSPTRYPRSPRFWAGIVSVRGVAAEMTAACRKLTAGVEDADEIA